MSSIWGSWKREQKLKKRRKFAILLRLALLASFFISAVVVGFLVLKVARSSSLPKNGRATVVFATKPVLLLSFEPQGELTVVSIPEKTYVETSRGFGSYRIGVVWELGEQEKLGGELLKETTQEFLGVPVDGWVGSENGKTRESAFLQNWKMENGKEEILSLKNKLTSWAILIRPKELLNFGKNLKTNLTIFDLARVWLRAKNTRFDKINFLDLGQTTALSSLILADGSTAKTFDQALLDAVCLGLFKDSRFSNEHIAVEVLNGTDKQGLANRVARLINNLGGEVVSVANSPQKASRCQIRGESQFLKSFTGQRLGQIFGCIILPEKPHDSRADIQILIGEDYWQKLYQR